jgi:hypothetical protein
MIRAFVVAGDVQICVVHARAVHREPVQAYMYAQET